MPYPARPPLLGASFYPTVPSLQLLVNNAGVTDGWKELGEVTAQDMLDCFTANCIGANGWHVS